MARSPTLAADDATKGGHRDVSRHTADQQMIGTDEVRLLPPQHCLSKSGQKQEKRERPKPMNNAMPIPGGHRQKRPRIGLPG
jgi:hypothetical protein